MLKTTYYSEIRFCQPLLIKFEQLTHAETRTMIIRTDETLLEHGYPEFATRRAYYAMFYTTEALLNEKDLHSPFAGCWMHLIGE
jgi:uncharacterized protein (UPF0332 family)